MANGDSERVSISRETLRAELTQMELRLVDRLSAALGTKADAVIVDQIEKRVSGLELSRAGREHMTADLSTLVSRVTRLERFRYGIPSLAALSFLLSVVLAASYYFANH